MANTSLKLDASTAADYGSHPLLRVIGRWSFTALIINCIIGSAIFGLPSAIAALLGQESLLAVLLAGLAAGLIMACFAEVASRFAGTGGPYLYVREAFGRMMGIQVGWLVWLVRLASCAANANLFVVYLGEFWPQSTQPVPRFLIITTLIGVLAIINFRGANAGTQVSNLFTAAKLLALGTVCVAGAFYLIATHRIVPAATAAPPAKAWMQAVVLLIFAYGGFETALISAGEVRDPQRDTAFGLFAGLAVCTLLYVLIQYAVVGVLPDPAHSERPLADVARIVMGRTGAAWIAAGALVSTYGFLSGNILSTPRITFALAERGDFPAWFAAVHPRFHTPYFSVFVFALLVWALALFGNFTGNATLSAGSRLFYYGLVCAALPVLRKKSNGRTSAGFFLPAGTLFAALGVLICLGLLTRIEFSKSMLLLVTMAVALLNWIAVRGKPSH